ncbi:MAG: T9SS type A sorting domain-containing protein, partial [Cytophagales bacterium]|nr:T9SS type A sorting domain-containing protein [Cytophagales bacterium]
NYKVKVSAAGCLAGTDSLTVATQGAIPVNATFCAPPNQLVPLSVTGTGKYKWWTASIGGSALATGSVYTPTLSTSSIFYVQDTATFSYGNFTPSAMLTGFNIRTGGSNTYMGFNAARAFRIDSVNLFIRTYNTTNAFMTVRLRQRGNATPLATKDLGVTGPCNCQTDRNVQFYLGFDVPVGNEYYLEYSTGSVNVHWDQNTASYPYQVPGIISIYGPVDGSGVPIGWAPSSYGFFYNWKISAGIACARVPVSATLNCPLGYSSFGISGVKKGETTYQLEWQMPVDDIFLSHFEIEHAAPSQGFVKVHHISHQPGTKSIHFPVTVSSPAGVHMFKVKAVLTDGSIIESNILAESFTPPVQVQVLPNPFNETIKVFVHGAFDGKNGKTEVYNTAGQLIFASALDKQETSINSQFWSSGVYIIKNQLDQTVYTSKLVKE